MVTSRTSLCSTLLTNSLNLTSSSGDCPWKVKRLNNRIMNRPTTTQKMRFFTREFILSPQEPLILTHHPAGHNTAALRLALLPHSLGPARPGREGCDTSADNPAHIRPRTCWESGTPHIPPPRRLGGGPAC